MQILIFVIRRGRPLKQFLSSCILVANDADDDIPKHYGHQRRCRRDILDTHNLFVEIRLYEITQLLNRGVQYLSNQHQSCDNEQDQEMEQ